MRAKARSQNERALLWPGAAAFGMRIGNKTRPRGAAHFGLAGSQNRGGLAWVEADVELGIGPCLSGGYSLIEGPGGRRDGKPHSKLGGARAPAPGGGLMSQAGGPRPWSSLPCVCRPEWKCSCAGVQ